MKQLVAAVLNKLGLLAHVQLRRRSPLGERGWFRTIQTGRSEDVDGSPLPWFSYPAIDFLAPRVAATASVFEYGAGNGTLWWAARVQRVVAVEHDIGWYERLLPVAPRNVKLIYIDLDDGDRYMQAPATTGERFDVVVIDGRKRVECAREAVQALKPDGVIIWDDMVRERYREGANQLHSKGFKSICFGGLGPGGVVDHGTTVFYRATNSLGI
jgi:hypothetical protein